MNQVSKSLSSLIEQDKTVRGIVWGTPAGFLAFGLGSGLSRYAPGTMGTIVAVPFALPLKNLPPAGFWLVLAVLPGRKTVQRRPGYHAR